MPFKILFHPKATDFLRKMDDNTKDSIKKKIRELEEYPERGKHLRYVPFWSLRAGDYRVIYEIKKSGQTIIVLFVGHRKDVYDDFSKLF